MNILKKLMTAIRSSAREVGEAVVDANSVAIFEQEIIDAEQAIEKAKSELTGVMAKRMQLARKVEKLNADVAENEGYAAQALEKGDESLALDVAKKIADIEVERNENQAAHDQMDHQVGQLKAQIQQAERTLGDYQRQLPVIKTTENIQKTNAAISSSFSNSDSSLLSAKESIERIKNRQQENIDRAAAQKELDAENVDAKLKSKLQEAGIVDSDEQQAESILARIKAKQK